MKIFAFYLPQFHEIPENNLWWGEGFTEWTNVKKAKPLFKGHVQPKRPVNGNYYNLLDKHTVEWQTSLLNKYHIDGLIYYHYYFKGKKLLEKPAENLLKWKELDQKYFFCWANHDWNKSWNGSRELLVKQVYGNWDDWEEHFNYLLPFFCDDRYEKKDNMPLFMIFESGFSDKNIMFEYFDKRCRDYGFSGLYLIESFNPCKRNFIQSISQFKKQKSTITKKIHLREPITCMAFYRSCFYADFPFRFFRKARKRIANRFDKPFLLKYDGNKFFELMMKYKKDEECIPGIFFGWDNTPRYNYRGYVISSPDYKHFKTYMDSVKNCEYLFVNAWNEWAEGMILEPTIENGYTYLEWLKSWGKIK